MKRVEIVLGGSAGQGLHFAGAVFCDAALLQGYKNISQLGIYSPAQRTGSSHCEIILATEEIDYPAAIQPNIILALTNAQLRSQGARALRGALLLADEELSDAKADQDIRIYKAPISSLAQRELGNDMLTALVGVGAISGLTKLLSLQSLEKVMQKQPEEIREINLKAVRCGYEVGISLQSHQEGIDVDFF